MPKQIQIHIPKPCHENWNEMSPNQQGAFCRACQKTVIDFSAKTENEIYDIFTGTKGSICGRFREDQVDTPITKSEVSSSFFNWKALAASLAVLFTADRSFGAKDNSDKPGSINRPPFVFKPPVVEKPVIENTYRMVGEVVFIKKPDSTVMKPEKAVTLPITIKGRVVDSISKKPLAGVWISITDSSNLYLYTDKDGYFSLKSSTGAGRISFNQNYDHDIKEMTVKELIALQKNNSSKPVEITLVPHEPIQMKMGKVSRPFP